MSFHTFLGEKMEYLNTDISDYLSENLKDGFPISSLRTREFEHDRKIYRDSVVQVSHHTDWFMNEKQRLLDENEEKYHQTTLSESDDKKFTKIISQYIGVYTFTSLRELCYDALPCDLAICRKDADSNHIAFVHLAFPNGWSAEDAIGKPFTYFHNHVKRDDKHLIPTTSSFVNRLIGGGKCYERVGAFSLRPSAQLDRHPNTPYSAKFKNNQPMFVRFERQVIIGVPEMDAFLFFIHTNLVDFRSRPELIKHAIENADPQCYPKQVLFNYRDYFLNYLNILLA